MQGLGAKKYINITVTWLGKYKNRIEYTARQAAGRRHAGCLGEACQILRPWLSPSLGLGLSRPSRTPVREHAPKSPLVPALARASTSPVRPLLLQSAQVKGCLGVAGVLEPRGPTRDWSSRRFKCASEGPDLRSGTRHPRPPEAAGGRPGWVKRVAEACWITPQPLCHPQPCAPCGRRLSTPCELTRVNRS